MGPLYPHGPPTPSPLRWRGGDGTDFPDPRTVNCLRCPTDATIQPRVRATPSPAIGASATYIGRISRNPYWCEKKMVICARWLQTKACRNQVGSERARRESAVTTTYAMHIPTRPGWTSQLPETAPTTPTAYRNIGASVAT